MVNTMNRSSNNPVTESSSKHNSGGPLFDHVGTMQRLGGDEQLLGDLIQFFMEDSPGLLERIKAAHQSGDAKQLERAAHSLKGLASNFGAQTLVHNALALELLGKAGDIHSAASFIGKLENGLEQLCAELTPYPHGGQHAST